MFLFLAVPYDNSTLLYDWCCPFFYLSPCSASLCKVRSFIIASMSFGRLRSNWTRHARGFATQNQYKNALERRAPIDIHPEVEDALVNNKPVVALETTVITHGLPHPQNHLLGRSLENIVRSTGSVPATIGVIGGRIKIGLEENELQRLAEKTHKPVKLSRRDLAAAIATKADGGWCGSQTL